MQRHTAPYVCHVFACVNDRTDGRRSCAHAGGKEIRLALKQQLAERGLTKPVVRVSQTGCLGQCAHGPNVMILPQDVWFSGVTLKDVPAIVDTVERLVRQAQGKLD